MFNETYGLQRAAIDGTKPMTRRSVPAKWQQPLTEIFEACNYDYSKFWQHPTVQLITNEKAPYKVGEVVAIAQSYLSILNELEDSRNFSCMEHWESKSSDRGKYAELAMYSPGGNNKMFVKADLMPHRIQFTANKVERLQDISDEDCLREGVTNDFKDKLTHGWHWSHDALPFDETYQTPREAFAALIDKVSGRGTWERNQWVFAYAFELVK